MIWNLKFSKNKYRLFFHIQALLTRECFSLKSWPWTPWIWFLLLVNRTKVSNFWCPNKCLRVFPGFLSHFSKFEFGHNKIVRLIPFLMVKCSSLACYEQGTALPLKSCFHLSPQLRTQVFTMQQWRNSIQNVCLDHPAIIAQKVKTKQNLLEAKILFLRKSLFLQYCELSELLLSRNFQSQFSRQKQHDTILKLQFSRKKSELKVTGAVLLPSNYLLNDIPFQ